MKLILLGMVVSASMYAETPKPASWADWNLPACRACESTLIQRNIAATYGGHEWPVFEGTPGTLPAIGEHTVSSEVGLLAWKGKAAGTKELPEDRKKQYSPSATAGSPGHIFWVIPAFKVDYGKGFQPLSPTEKFQQWAQGEYDPLGVGVGAVEAATLEHSSTDGFCGYGPGWAGYGKCFGALELDATNSSFLGDFLLPVVLHQDPRYFRLGEGSIGRRVWYAVSRVFVTYNDAGHTVFYSSALAGTAIAAGLSNLYYPPQDAGVIHTMTRIAIDLANTAMYNAAAEFWPEIHRKLKKIF